MNDNITVHLAKLFKSHFGFNAEDISGIRSAGSTRRYYRLIGDKISAIGVWNDNKRENEAYLSFSKSFLANNLPVPEVFAKNLADDVYLIEDLGNKDLFSMIPREDYRNLPVDVIQLYKKAIDYLPAFQVSAGKSIDYGKCYPREKFDRQSIIWDLNYFKYHFVKLSDLRFDEQALEDDFSELCDYILQSPSDYFMYRDFQSRNILIKDNQPYFIDFQGGRKGPLQYDIVSLLYQVKAHIPEDDRQVLLDHYLHKLKENGFDSIETFYNYYPEIVLLRLLQVLGAYGFRGLHEKRKHFIESLPYAVESLENTLERFSFSVKIPEIRKISEQIISGGRKKFTGTSKLKVSINSFSFKKGYPDDRSGNGGGFVIDCRSLPNPGREKKYSEMTGRDQEVIDFLENKSEIHEFIDSIIKLIDPAIKNYVSRDFTNLMVSFGCTGGQHRSVYFAEKIAEYIKQNYPVIVSINHIEQDILSDG